MMIPGELDVRHDFVEANGLRMHYVEKGQGPLVVLLHGFPEMWWSWRYQIRALADAGYRAVAPDLRGYNDTDAQGPYDIDTLRDDVVAFIDKIRRPGDGKPIVVAHDWGGGVAWHLASTRPDLCAKLVVMNCPHPLVFMRSLFRNGRQIARSWYMFFFQIPLVPERLLTLSDGAAVIRALRGLAVDKSNFGSDELAPFVDAVRKPGRAKAMIGWYRAAIRAGLRGGPNRVARSGGYQRITIPTLLLWAMDDTALGTTSS
jgi:pimeloyl-ACP methyl ester carboxylesterase